MIDMIDFKSIPENYLKEYLGKKNNTFRKVDSEDKRFKILKDWDEHDTLKIRIINSCNHFDHFDRTIKDVTFWEDYVIITWFLECRV